MTRHDDPSWRPEDDELVRAALMSLMDDVSAEPLPEPETVRARAEGRGPGSVSDLAVHRSRRRSFAFLAGAAAAAVVATTAGLYVANQSPDRPVATSSTDDRTSTTSSSSSEVSRLTMLDARSWASILGRPVATTTTDAPDGRSCFEPSGDATWTRGSPRLPDGRIPATQWIGTPGAGSEPVGRALEAAGDRCPDRPVHDRTSGTLTGGATYRARLVGDAQGGRTWWLEVTSGDALSFLTVPEAEGARSPADVRRVARAVIGDLDLSRETSTSTSTTGTATSSPTRTSSAPQTTVIPPPEPTGTRTGGTTTPPSTPSGEGTVDDADFVPAGQWASQALTGGAATTAGPLHLEGSPPYIEACISSELDAPVEAIGIRSGPGEDNYFARQYIAVSSDADTVRSELLSGYGSGSCPGPAIGGTSTRLTPSIFKLEQGDLTSYIAVVRMQGDAVSVLHLTEAKTAPAPLTDAVAVSELQRVADLAAAR